MRKLISLTLALCLCLGLTACAGAGGENGGDQDVFTTDLSAFYDDMFSTIFPDPNNAPSMSEVTGDYLDQLYPGLSEVETTQCLVYAPMITAVAYEIALVEVADAADVQTVQDIFQARIDSQVEGGAFYPETVEAWQNGSEIVVRGNCVCLFVGAEKDDMVAAFNAL